MDLKDRRPGHEGRPTSDLRDAQSALAFSLRRAFPLPSPASFTSLLEALDQHDAGSRGRS